MSKFNDKSGVQLSNLEKLKRLRARVNWEVEKDRQEFLRQLYPLLKNWKGLLPNLRDIFQPEEIDWILSQAVKNIENDRGQRIIEFLVDTGYKDEPKVDENGRQSLHRTTPVHHVARRDRKVIGKLIQSSRRMIPKLFIIYNGFDVNYIDELGYTHFHVACLTGCYEVVEKFLKLGQDANCFTENSVDPPLHLALIHNRKEVIRLLLEYRADPNLLNTNELAALHIICKKSVDDCVLANMLFEFSHEQYKPLQVNVLDKSGDSLLHVALSRERSDLFRLLLRNGVDPNLANAEGWTPMQIICRERNADELLERFFDLSNDQYQPVRVNAQDRLGRTLLHVALSRGHINWVKFLLRNGADPNLANNDGLTPLHFLSKSDYGDKMAETFFKICDEKYQTLQINAQDKIGKTPLHYTLADGCKKQILRVLLKKGADSNLADEEGLTPTHVVCKRNNDDKLAELFFEINDDNQQIVQVNTQDKLGWTPLHYALANNGKNSVRALLRRGVSPNLVNAEGSTPLHIVSKRGKNSLVLATMLFEMCDNRRQPVQVNVQDNLGNTPLHLSEAALDDDVSKLLLRRDADPNVVNKEGLTPLHIICDESHDFGLAKTFFKINDDRNQLVQVNAKDNLGRTSLQLAVANLLTDVVDLLLDHGADLSSFFFPPASSFGLGFEIRLEKSINLKQVSSALIIIERLERRGYELDQTDALTMMKFFTKYEVFEKSTNLVKSWCKNIGFAREAKKVKIRPELSLYDLFLLRPEETKKLVTYTEYFKLAKSAAWRDIPEASIQPCVLNLCEKQLRRFFRQWALEFFLILIWNRLPIECCDMILDEESLTNKDLYHICLAATGQS